MRNTRIRLRVATVAAFAAAGLSLAGGAAQARPSLSVQENPVSTQATSRGIYPDEECKGRAKLLMMQGITAWCEWHPPIQIGYMELLTLL
jgi:hypothetical protein